LAPEGLDWDMKPDFSPGIKTICPDSSNRGGYVKDFPKAGKWMITMPG
jgi:hypothetical protein